MIINCYIRNAKSQIISPMFSKVINVSHYKRISKVLSDMVSIKLAMMRLNKDKFLIRDGKELNTKNITGSQI